MQKLWRIKEDNPVLQKQLAAELNIHPILTQLLINRGISNYEEGRLFLDCSLSSLEDPYNLHDMDRAVDRIKRAVRANERLLVWGDYDADGVTASTLLVLVLKRLGADVSYYIPHRLKEGYGLTMAGIEYARSNNIDLIITVDCGITNQKEVEFLNKLGIDTIITDHHMPQEELPSAHSVINPLKEDCSYPYKYLSGVGLAFKLGCALLKDAEIFEHLDLVALGTVTDVSPMSGENRILVKHGLDIFTRTKKKGLKALLESARLGGKSVDSFHLAYILGPRINAQGRMAEAALAVNLLLSDDEAQARDLSQHLEVKNRERKVAEDKILSDALIRIERDINFKDDVVIVLESDQWHPGVIGIVASKLADRFNRPTILIAMDGKIGKGSGRSIRDFHILDALKCAEHLILEFGGHKYACGLSIHKDNISEFKESLNRIARKALAPEELIPRLDIDLKLSLGRLEPGLVNDIHTLGPFGPSNPKPLFVSERLQFKSEPKIVGKNTVKFWVSDEEATFEAIGFGMLEDLYLIQRYNRFNLAYSPSTNDWQGEKSIQLEIKDIMAAQ